MSSSSSAISGGARRSGKRTKQALHLAAQPMSCAAAAAPSPGAPRAAARPARPRSRPVEAPDLGRQAHVVGGAVVAGEMRAHAVAQVHALADVERQVVHAVEAVDARALGQRLRARRAASCGGRLGILSRRFTAASISSGVASRVRSPARSATARARRPARSGARCARRDRPASTRIDAARGAR